MSAFQFNNKLFVIVSHFRKKYFVPLVLQHLNIKLLIMPSNYVWNVPV